MVVEALMKKQRQQQKGVVLGASHLGGKHLNREMVKGNVGMKNGAGSSSSSYGGKLGEENRGDL